MLRRFDIEETQRFVHTVDAELSAPCSLVLAGETALSLGYCPDRSIVDLEVWSTTDRVIWTAAERAGEMIPRPIRLRQSPLVQPEMSFEGRLQESPVLTGMRSLKVLVPEAHDLVLLLAPRALSPSAFADLHRNHPLSLPTLVERYHEMARELPVPRERLKASFLVIVAKLFGDAKAAALGREFGGGTGLAGRAQ